MLPSCSRRQFLRGALPLVAGMPLAGVEFPVLPRRLKKVGVVLGLVSRELEADYLATLEALAAAGYREVEFGRPVGAAADFRRALERLKLRAVAGGASLSDLLKDLEKHIESCHYFGKRYLVCYWPWMHDGGTFTLEEVRRTAAEFNRLGERCRAEGLRFAFHNHDKEFRRVEGRVAYDVFLEETDPALVTMEIDLYWIRKGGGDPLDYFARYPGRFELCHVKDMDATPAQFFADPGKGIIDFAAIFSQAKRAGLQHFIVERDQAEEGLRTAVESIAFLDTLRF